MSLAAKKLGYSFSAMRISERFAMSEFKDALLDWGFFGDPEDRPDWLAQQAGDSGLRATD